MTKEQLEAKGGVYWEAGDKKRVYFNNINELAGWKISRYGTGNISCASFGGKGVSNTFARKHAATSLSKLWYDFKDGKFHSKNLPAMTYYAAVEEIKK